MKQIKDIPEKAVAERCLKSGYVDNNVFKRIKKGSEQGLVISPLLANIALHGMEEQLDIKYRTLHGEKMIKDIHRSEVVKVAV